MVSWLGAAFHGLETALMRLTKGGDGGLAFVSTGVRQLDTNMHGGYLGGSVIEIFGDAAVGKSTLAYSALRGALAQGHHGVLVDADGCFDERTANQTALNDDRLVVVAPRVAEEAFEISHRLMKTKAVRVLVVDSLAALVPRGEMERQLDGAERGLQLDFFDKEVRSLSKTAVEFGTVVILVNQTRTVISKLGTMVRCSLGESLMKKYAATRIEVCRGFSTPENGDFRLEMKVLQHVKPCGSQEQTAFFVRPRTESTIQDAAIQFLIN